MMASFLNIYMDIAKHSIELQRAVNCRCPWMLSACECEHTVRWFYSVWVREKKGVTHLERPELHGESKNSIIWRKVGRTQPGTQGKKVNALQATERTVLRVSLLLFTSLSPLLIHKTHTSMVPRSWWSNRLPPSEMSYVLSRLHWITGAWCPFILQAVLWPIYLRKGLNIVPFPTASHRSVFSNMNFIDIFINVHNIWVLFIFLCQLLFRSSSFWFPSSFQPVSLLLPFLSGNLNQWV